MEKKRAEGLVTGDTLFARVENRAVVIIDDLISTGTTISRAARVCLDQGAARVFAAATHGLFVGDAEQVVAAPGLSKTVVTDTVPPFRLDPKLVEQKVVVLSAASLFADAIKAIHEGGSIAAIQGG
jgi:ribose-phosphate pyrophosphokinase